MHIHAKLITGLLILLIGIAASITLAINLYLLPHVQVIEEQNLNTDLERVTQIFEQELVRLNQLSNDWGQWDDTYDYMVSKNPEYTTSNLTPSLLSTVNADLLAFVTTEGKVLQIMTNPSVPQEASLQGTILANDHPFRRITDLQNTRGLFMTVDGPMLMAASAILPSEGYKAERGTLVFGKRLDAEFQKYIGSVTRLAVTFNTTQDNFTHTRVMFPSNNEALAQKTLSIENDSESVLSLTIRTARPYYQEANAVVHYTLLIIGGMGIFVSLFAYLFLKSTIVNPILMLKTQAETFGKKRTLLGFKPLTQNDELGELSLSFLNMARQLADSQGALEQERQRYMDASLTDPMTKLRNRRFLDQYFAESRALQTPEPVLIMMIDLDHFKNVNDTYGHDSGDQVLCQLSELLVQLSRENDLVVRYGGEEFMLVCRHTKTETACAIAERIRTQVESFEFCADKTPIHMTCSIGFFTCLTSTVANAEDWYSMAKVSDLALYAAKHSGRNTWVGLTAEKCKTVGSLPTHTEEIKNSLAAQRLKSCCHCGDITKIRWC